MYLQISKSVDALRPEAERLLVCSCDEYKQLQRMSMDISLQHLSECAVCWFLGQNEFAKFVRSLGIEERPKNYQLR